jgi:hypothetical protein
VQISHLDQETIVASYYKKKTDNSLLSEAKDAITKLNGAIIKGASLKLIFGITLEDAFEKDVLVEYYKKKSTDVK